VLTILVFRSADKSVTNHSLTKYSEGSLNHGSACIRAVAAALTYFSAERVTTVQSLFARTIDRLLGWETLRDQVSTLRTHNPSTVSLAEATFRHLTPSVVPGEDIGGMLFLVLANHFVNMTSISRYGSYVSCHCHAYDE
jgi:hypothetical protein